MIIAGVKYISPFDFVFANQVALEVDGGGFINGRHSRGTGIEKDAEKFSEAAILGWRILRVTPKQIRSGQALTWVERAVETRASAWRR